MEDKELYEFFRSRKNTFDREPSESLWKKIDKGLTNPTPAASKPLWLKSWIVLPAMACITIVAFYVYKTRGAATDLPVPGSVEDIRISVPESEADQIVESEIQMSGPNATDTVRKKKTVGVLKKQDAALSEKNHEFVVAPPRFRALNQQNTDSQMDTVRVNTNNLVTETVITKGRIVVTTKEKLTTAQFKALTYEILEENKQSIGSTVIIKAPGHAIFRQIIKNTDNTNSTPAQFDVIQFKNDSVKSIPLNNLKTKIFTIKNQNDTLSDDIIEEFHAE